MDKTPKSIIQSILRCSKNYFQVLQLQPEPISEQEIRRSYKRLALLIHPDKTKEEDAEEAFKHLGHAYENLLDPELQAQHLVLIKKEKERRGYKRKAKDKSNSSRPPPKPRRRSAREIWEEFEKEEELFCKKQLRQKEHYRQRQARKRERKMEPMWTENEIEHVVAQSEEKVASWRQFQKKNAPDDPKDLCCLLCRRRFESKLKLQLHRDKSELHQHNLAKLETQD